jgi:pyrophosphatase PpaX
VTKAEHIQQRGAAPAWQALLFDLDGTVLDSKELILASFHYACDQVLGHRIPDERLLELVGIPLAEQMEKLTGRLAEAMVESYREHNAKTHGRLIECFPGMAETLAWLVEAGWPLAIVTSKRNDFARQGLDCFGLTKYFLQIVGSDCTARHKPHPDPLLYAADLLGQKPEACVYIGDSPYDMQAACAAGMLAVGAAWGMFQAEQLRLAGAQIILQDIRELPNALGLAK